MDALKEYWGNRSPRDRRIIALIAALAALSLFYAYVWMPMNAARAQLRAELPKLRGEAMQMVIQAQEVERLKASPAQARGAPQQIINQSAEKAGIKGNINQVTPLSAERVQVTLNSVAFDNWIRWAQMVATESGLRIDSAQVTLAGEPGLVKVQAVFVVPGR